MKKLLALLIAVMMVVALVPATVLSAIVPAIQSLDDGGDEGGNNPPAGDTPAPDGGVVSTPVEDLSYDDNANAPDERLEEESAPAFDKEFTAGVDKLEIVNKDGVLVGYFADLASADKWVRDGDTLRLLADISLTAPYFFGTGREALGGKADAAVRYTIDGVDNEGNGHTVYYRGDKPFALYFTYTSRYHNVTLKGLNVASETGAIAVYLNHTAELDANNNPTYCNSSGGTGVFTFENCKLYANDAYYYVNPQYYEDAGIAGKPWVKNASGGNSALYSNTLNTNIVIKGADTVFHGNSGCAVSTASVVTIFDGEFYSAWADATVQVSPSAATRNSHKLTIYGGTFINDNLCAVRAINGAQLWIFDGEFIMTGETTDNYSDAAAIRTSGWNNSGYVYIMGGDFYLDAKNDAADKNLVGAAVWSIMDYSPAYITGGNFYHNNADNAFGGKTINISRFATEPKTDAVTDNNTKTVVSNWAQKTVTWNYVTSLSFDNATYGTSISADGAILDADGNVLYDEARGILFDNESTWYEELTKAEVAILDADGKIVNLLDIDNDTDDASSIHYGQVGEGNGRLTDLESKLYNSWFFVPEGGTWRMVTDIKSTADLKKGEGVGMFWYGGPENANIDGNGHLFSYTNTAEYFTFSFGRTNVTFKNIIMENPTGRGLQFGNACCLNQVWTLGEGVTVRAGNGSAVYLCPEVTLNVEAGATLEGCAETALTESSHLVQIRPNVTFNLNGGTLKPVTGDLYAGAIFWVLNDGDRIINLNSGEIYLAGNNLQALRFRNGVNNRFALNVTDQVKFYTLDGAPALQYEGNAAVVTNVGEEAVEYATFAEAMAAVKNGAVVELLRDVRAFGTTVINCDMTLLGNGYTVYQQSPDKYEFLFHVKGENADVLFDNVAIVTISSGIYVSPNEQAQYDNGDATTSPNDDVVINVTLNNCKVYAGAFEKDACESIDSLEGEKNLQLMMAGTTHGALYSHGEGTYVKITGKDSFYACSTFEAITNFGGYLDIYDGFAYAYKATQVMQLRGRLDIAGGSNQMRSATTAIYGGVFLAGSRIDMSVIRTLRGHSLVIVGGEFIMVKGADPNDGDRHVIRVSDSSKAGYLYVLGGSFYQSSEILPIFGYGGGDVNYIRIWGGDFWGNCATGIANRHLTTNSFNNNTCGVDAAYGMYIDEGYLIQDITYAEGTAKYDIITKSNYVKQTGDYRYRQLVVRDDEWAEDHGYEIAYLVTDSAEDKVPTAYYGFELERALYHVGNGGTLTLARNVAMKQPAKATKTDDMGDTDYGFFGRYRPAASLVTFNGAYNNENHAITATATAAHLLNLAGGTYVFDNFSFTNETGGILKFCSDNTTVKFLNGQYSGHAVSVNGVDTNDTKNACLILEGGEFRFTGTAAAYTMFAIKGNANVIFGKQGKQVGPLIYMDTMETAINISATVAGEKGATVHIYFADIFDLGTDGRIFTVSGNAKNYELNIYDGDFVLSNTSRYNSAAYWPLLQTADGSDGTINVYGGKFTRNELKGEQGDGNRGKLMILEGDGTVNLVGGEFYQHGQEAILMSVRKNIITLNIGDSVTGEGPIFKSTFMNDKTMMLCADSDNTTQMTMNIYGGQFIASNGGFVHIGASSDVKGSVNIYGGSFTLSGSDKIAGFDSGNGAINFYNGVVNSTGSGGGVFTATGAGSVNLYGGTFNAPSNKFLSAVNGSVFNVYGGTYDVNSDFLYCGITDEASFTLNVGMSDGSSGPVIVSNTLVSTWLEAATGDNIKTDKDLRYISKLAANVTVFAGDFTFDGNGLAYYHRYGDFTIYDGNFTMLGANRMFRVGGFYEGAINIYGGTFNSEASDCLAVVDDSAATVVLGKPDGTGPVMNCSKDSALEVSTTGTVVYTVYGGSYTTTWSQHTFNWAKSGENSVLLIESGSFSQNHKNHANSSALWFNVTDGKGTCTINGGSFYTNNNGNACVYIAAGDATVNGGYFYGNGMCVIGVIGGSGTQYVDGQDKKYDKGYIKTPSTAVLTINGGLFYLDSNWQRPDNDATNRDDAVVRVGGGTGYGTIIINGGTYISASKNGSRVINKINPTSTIELNGGIFMAGSRQEYYFYSTGNLYAAEDTEKKNPLNGKLDPEDIPVDRKNDQTTVYNGVTYRMHIIGDYGASYYKVTEKAEIRIMAMETGSGKQYTGGLRFTTNISNQTILYWASLLPSNAIPTNLKWGTIIVPVDYVNLVKDQNGSFTKEDLEAAGLKYLDIEATDSFKQTETGVTFTAAITDILEENYGRRFTAVGYMLVTMTVGEEEQTQVFYTDYDAAGDSLAELATILLENETNNTEPYSAELKAQLSIYAAALPEGDRPDAGDRPSIPDDTGKDDFGVIGGKDDDDDTVGDNFPDEE